jgi:tetratricopeptide (TPR) repeat protein
MRAVLIILIILLCSTVLSAQNSHPYSCRFEHYFIIGDMDSWLALVDSLQEEKLSKLESDVLVQAQYGLMGYFLSQNRKERASQQFVHFEKLLEKLLEIYPNNPNYLSMKAASIGFRIGISPWRAPFLNSQHISTINRALEQGPGLAFPLIEYANSLYFRPSIVGGDKEKAKEYYEKALGILEQQPDCNWQYYSIGSWLAQVYLRLGEEDKGYELFHKLLEEAPDFEYVKDELLPQLENGEYNDLGTELEQRLMAN